MHDILLGTIVFAVTGVVLCMGLGGYVLKETKEQEDKKENTSIMCVSVTLAVVCTWIMWVCTYMHQMNPLINPHLEHEK